MPRFIKIVRVNEAAFGVSFYKSTGDTLPDYSKYGVGEISAVLEEYVNSSQLFDILLVVKSLEIGQNLIVNWSKL